MPNPMRMCVNCRTRANQIDLIRLQCKGKILMYYTHNGRSFYICQNCFDVKDKRLLKALSRACKKEIKITELECLING